MVDIKIRDFVILLVIYLTQIFFINDLEIFGLYVPYPYILIILLVASKFNRETVIIASSILGYILDFFSNTNWIHTISSIILAYVCKYINYFYSKRDKNNLEYDLYQFMKRLLLSIFIHHSILYYLDYYSLSYELFYGILINTVVTFLFSIILQLLFFNSKSTSRLR